MTGSRCSNRISARPAVIMPNEMKTELRPRRSRICVMKKPGSMIARKKIEIIMPLAELLMP